MMQKQLLNKMGDGQLAFLGRGTGMRTASALQSQPPINGANQLMNLGYASGSTITFPPSTLITLMAFPASTNLPSVTTSMRFSPI